MNLRITAVYKDLVTQLMEFESGQLSTDEIVELFQDLIDTDTLSHLQGSYQRVAEQLLTVGLIHERKI